MAIDIFAIEPSKISRDLKGKYLLLFGAPKVGKTSFAVQAPRALVCAFEMGTNALANVKAAPMLKWVDFKNVVKQLREPRAKEMYDTVVIDTVSIAYSLCEKYICQRGDVQELSEFPWGSGWTQLKKEFQDVFREITTLGYGLIFLAHSKEKKSELKDENGDSLTIVSPDIPNTIYTIVNAIVDIIGYIAVEIDNNGESHRYLYTRQTPTVFAGSRYEFMEPKIPFGYQSLVDSIGRAIDKSIATYGENCVGDSNVITEQNRPFSETMDEARDLFYKMPDKPEVTERINKSIKDYFGTDTFRLSEAKESQQDLVEAVISDMRQILEENS